jgi:hypothetical protein
MYGEPLPQLFFEISPQDVARADCVIIMGTSLAVKPFSEKYVWSPALKFVIAESGDLPERVGPLVPRLLMNMTGVAKEAGLRIGQVQQPALLLSFSEIITCCFRMAPLFPEITVTFRCWATLKTPSHTFAAWSA